MYPYIGRTSARLTAGGGGLPLKLTKSSSIDPQDTGLEPAVNPPGSQASTGPAGRHLAPGMRSSSPSRDGDTTSGVPAMLDIKNGRRPQLDNTVDQDGDVIDILVQSRRELSGGYTLFWVYPGFPTPFWGLSGFFVGDLIGKALWELVENAQRFPRHGGRVLCVHGAVSFHRARPCATRWLPGRGPMRDVELDRCVLGLQSTGEQLCSRQHRRPVHAERSIYPGKTGISGAYAIWETRI